MKMKVFNKFFLLAVLLFILGVSLLFFFYFSRLSVKEQSVEKNNTFGRSERSETFTISGEEAGYFSKVIFDPFLVRQGEKQTIILILNSSENVKKIKIETKDGAGKYEKSFERTLEEKEKINYKITWKPKNLKANTSYSVRFIYETYNSKINEMTLTWYSTK